MSLEEILERIRSVHGDKYDLSLITNGTSTNNKVRVICPKHGEFNPPLKHLLRGSGCPKCSGKMRKTFEEFEKEATAIHNGKYIYNDRNYINSHTPIMITCPKHGDFPCSPTNHLNGNGCPECKAEKLSEMFASSTEEFIKKARKVHGEKYDYSKTIYKNNRTPTTFICPTHGEFQQTPQGHLSGRGCSKCRESKLEREIINLLDENKIDYKYQWHLPWAKYYSLDFYIPSKNIGIECQGIQHFEDGRFKKMSLNEIKQRDEFKLNTCNENGIKILYYANIEGKGCITDKEELLKEIL